MSAEMQTMRDTITAIGTACAELAAVVEGLPKFLENQIGSFKAELSVKFVGLEDKLRDAIQKSGISLQDMQAGIATFEGQVRIEREAYMQNAEDKIVELRQVIDGNASSAASSNKTILDLLSKHTVDLENIPPVIEALRSATDKHSTDLVDQGTSLKALEDHTAEKFVALEQRAVVLVDDCERRLLSDTKVRDQSLVTLETKVNIALEAQVAAVDEQQSALFASIAEIKEQATTADSRGSANYLALAKGTADLGETFAKEITSARTTLLAGIEEAKARVEAVESFAKEVNAGVVVLAGREADNNAARAKDVSDFTETLVVKITDGHTLLSARIAQAFDDINSGVDTAKETRRVVDAIDIRWVAEHGLVNEAIADLDNRLISTAANNRIELTARVDELKGTYGLLPNLVESCAQGLVETKERVALLDKAVVEIEKTAGAQADGHRDEIAGLQEAVGEHKAALDVVASIVKGTVVEIAEELTVLNTALETKADAEQVNAASKDLLNYLDESVARDTEASQATANISAEVKALAGAITEYRNLFTKTIEDLDTGVRSRIEALPDYVMLAALETRTSARHTALADDIADVRQSIPSIPDQTGLTDQLAVLALQVSEVEQKMIAKVADMATQFQPIVTAPEMELALDYTDGKLNLTASLGDKSATTSIPVSIGVRYRGIYKADADTQPGDLVTHKGSMWFCRSPKAGEPSKDFTGWQLAVKSGGNGKDGHSVKVYERHREKNAYREGDFLRINNRLWQCALDTPANVPEPGDIATTSEWILIAGAN